jgi:hypothetical protein
MTPEAKFRDPEIHCSKFGDLNDTRRQLQGPPVNFSPTTGYLLLVPRRPEQILPV